MELYLTIKDSANTSINYKIDDIHILQQFPTEGIVLMKNTSSKRAEFYPVLFLAKCSYTLYDSHFKSVFAFYIDEYGCLQCQFAEFEEFLFSYSSKTYSVNTNPDKWKLINYNGYCELCEYTHEKPVSFIEYALYDCDVELNVIRYSRDENEMLKYFQNVDQITHSEAYSIPYLQIINIEDAKL